MLKRITIILFFIILNINLFSQDKLDTIKLIKGSNIYIRIFLFFFPITNKYDYFYYFNKDDFSMELIIKMEDIKNEPSTPPIFTTDLIFRIDKIPYNKSGTITLPTSIRCNKRTDYLIVLG